MQSGALLRQTFKWTATSRRLPLVSPLASPRFFSSSAGHSSSSASASTATTPTPTPSTTTTPQPRRADLFHRDLQYLAQLSTKDLAAFDPTLDLHPHNSFTPPLSPSQPHPVHVTHINSNPQIKEYAQPRPNSDLIDNLPGEDDSTSHLAQLTHLSPNDIRNLYRFPLIVKRVVSMKSKGKMPSMYSLVVVGNGQGLVGLGEGNDETANKAVSKAFNQAVKSMDYVERYEDRTVWGTMESNFGSCKIQMRSRPPGFGLRVNHYLHQVAKAAGISDLSAKVYGSRNGTRVIKLAVAMLHNGSNPVDMGGFGFEKGQRRNKKTRGMQTAEDVGRARGRKAISA